MVSTNCYNLDCQHRSQCRDFIRFSGKRLKCDEYISEKEGEKKGINLKSVSFLIALRRGLSRLNAQDYWSDIEFWKYHAFRWKIYTIKNSNVPELTK